MADALDSKSSGLTTVRVQIPPPAPHKKSDVTECFGTSLLFLCKEVFRKHIMNRNRRNAKCKL